MGQLYSGDGIVHIHVEKPHFPDPKNSSVIHLQVGGCKWPWDEISSQLS